MSVISKYYVIMNSTLVVSYCSGALFVHGNSAVVLYVPVHCVDKLAIQCNTKLY